MATQFYGQPTPAQIITHTDTLATVLAAAYVTLGSNAAGDVTSVSGLADVARKAQLGDGSTLYGLGNPPWQSDLTTAFAAFVKSVRYDVLFKRAGQNFRDALNNAVINFLPAGWNFTTGGISMPLDAHLLRLNGAHTGVPATPPSAGTLTATNDATGTLPAFLVGSCPVISHTFVGTNSYDESLPATNATTAALPAPNNAFTYQIPGTVPAGTTFVNVYRSLVGGATRYYLKQVAVVAGQAFPAILIAEPDSVLRVDVQPPSWMQIPIMPEAAALLAAANGTLPTSDLGDTLPMVITGTGMVSASNVAAIISTRLLGLNNPAQSAQFGTSTVTASNTQTWTAGALQVANTPANALQGFAGAIGTGATGLRARVTTTLNNTVTLTYSYTFYDAAHGWGNVQTSSGNTVNITNITAGQVNAIGITAGQVVRSFTVTAVSGSGTSGAVLIEAVAPRSY